MSWWVCAPMGARASAPRASQSRTGAQETSGLRRRGFFPRPRSQPLGTGGFWQRLTRCQHSTRCYFRKALALLILPAVTAAGLTRFLPLCLLLITLPRRSLREGLPHCPASRPEPIHLAGRPAAAPGWAQGSSPHPTAPDTQGHPHQCDRLLSPHIPLLMNPCLVPSGHLLPDGHSQDRPRGRGAKSCCARCGAAAAGAQRQGYRGGSPPRG